MASATPPLRHNLMNITRRPTPCFRRNPTVFHLRKCGHFWKLFSYQKRNTNKNHFSPSFVGRGGVGKGRGGGAGKVEVSARKLAAALWQQRLAACVSRGGGGGLNLKCESSIDSLEAEIESSLLYSKHTMEGATKWDPRCSRTADKLCYFCVCMKLLKDHANSTASVASFIQAELFHAQWRIQELEAEQQSFQKEVKHLLKKLEEKTTSWLRRELQKMNAVLNDLKNDLSNQRKKYQTMEIISSELVNEMADVKLSEKQFKKDYEEEKKGRELMEEVCKELARKSAEEKAMLEAMKMESIKIWEEVEEERKMLQIAEVWPEERVQMKLTDAILALEDKNCEMNKLIADFEAFLMSGSATLDVRELRKAELFIQAAKSVNIEDIKEFSYMPSKPSDVYSILEEVKQLEADKRMVEQCSKYSPVSGVSTIQTEQTASSVAKQCNNQHLLNYSNGSIANNSQFEEYAKAWESHSEEEVSSYSLEGSNTTVNGIKIREGNCKNAWQSAREWKETIRNDSLNTQMSGFCSAEQSSHNIPFTAALLGSSSLSNSRRSKITFDDGRDWRSSNDTISSLKRTSPKRKLCEGRPRLLRDLANPHVTRGMKGWIEWPRQIQKNSLKKAKLLQVSLESQKAHLRSFFERKT